jgi:hypothetical protein
MYIEFSYNSNYTVLADWSDWLNENIGYDKWQWTRESFAINNKGDTLERIAGINLSDEDALAFKIRFGL